ncbi:TPA: Ail/Lom family outer membrane beta-barrel protein [Escherichia coli]|nr:Ail/Lom family outer membrane beta-barrel protein [Escherichia coli]HAX1983220.1 Ail/Lom family outer membrane beta-barrel protein [Escherichia coli]HAX2347553.1 Ail/Lom family outer membrane beta-barrel protein [Escherichia coli]HBN7445803.1 Ail/Lom family outer membrane beta-barrel protein [Escherichia coli]HDH7113448.1 Ail/Lom family outer membrane beta-barrel protein [Escherichia coli]
MKNKVKLISCAMLCGVCFTGVAHASSGDSSLSVGYARFQASGLKDVIKAANIVSSTAADIYAQKAMTLWEYQNTTMLGQDAEVKDPDGFNVKYRYEITDELGVMTSFTWARYATSNQYIAQQNWHGLDPTKYPTQIKNPVGSMTTNIKGSYWSLLAGPTWRFNDYVSLYALGGVGVAKLSVDFEINNNISGERLSEKLSDRKTSFAWAAGAQFNIYDDFSFDVGYESSGSGDWRTSGVTVGIGLKF